MEGRQVRALYDFTGEPGTSELSIIAGEVLTVMRDNVGDGWCEGFNQSGKSGLFPAAYVQTVETTASAPNAMTSSQQSSGDYWDDDWDDDSEVGQTQAYVPSQQQQLQHMIQLPQQHSVDYGDSVSMQTYHSVIPERPIPNIPKKNNKFSTLIKSGEDSFLLGTKVANVPESEKISIEEIENGSCRWVPRGEAYNCVVTSPKKESKLKGLKSFIVYQLTPTVIVHFYIL
ncbi:Sorting nexin lst-4 [Anthophora retusa]